jgi:hypothetical protein
MMQRTADRISSSAGRAMRPPEVGLRFAAEEFANPAHRLVRMFHDQQTPADANSDGPR